MDSIERDLDFVIVTGAGASRAFGAGGKTLPLMNEWCEELVALLNGHPGYNQLTGLHAKLPPEEFEHRLGRFLHGVAAFDEIERLVTPSKQTGVMSSNPALTADGVLEGWHSGTAVHLREIVELIRQSLYELFASPALDIRAAAAAYADLFRLIGIDVSSSRWVYATTNYDVLAESVIAQLGGRPDWGDLTPLRDTSALRVDVTGLVDGIPRHVPVLHLHGRVGWYRMTEVDRSDYGHVYSSFTEQYRKGYGLPIVMLPDTAKIYSDDDIIRSIWDQFLSALRRAKRVLVLGHSLHDPALVSAIRENVQPMLRVAVTTLPVERDGSVPPGEHDRIKDLLGPEVTVLTTRFGQKFVEGRDPLVQWPNTKWLADEDRF